MGGAATVLNDSILEEGNNGSLNVESSLSIPGFGTNFGIDVAIMIVELQRVCFDLTLSCRLVKY